MRCVVWCCVSVAVYPFFFAFHSLHFNKLWTGYRYVEFSFVIHIHWHFIYRAGAKSEENVLYMATSFGSHLKFFDLTSVFRSFDLCEASIFTICSVYRIHNRLSLNYSLILISIRSTES